MLPLWVWISALAGLFSNAGNFLSRVVLRDGDDSTAFAWYSEALRFVLFGIVAIFDWRFVVTERSILLITFICVTEVVAIYYIMRMHALSHLSVSSILSRSRLFWVPVFAFLLAGERLRTLDYLGIVILFVGISIAVAPRHLAKDAGMKAATISALFIALEIVFIQMLLPSASIGAIQAISFLPATLMFPLFVKGAPSRIITHLKTSLTPKTISILCFFIANYMFMTVQKITDASKVTAIYQGMMIFSVLAGIVILKEREDVKKKLLGTVIVLVGVALLS